MIQNKKICVLGLGYIGLPTAALLANRGYQVQGVDVLKNVVDTINRGSIHIVEPDLDTFVHAAVNSGNLKASLDPTEADIFIIAVPTPFQEHYVPNIDYVIQATKTIAPFLREGNIVILESTSPVGTTEKIAAILNQLGVDISTIHIAHCPERVLPGHIMKELITNDRIVGGITIKATKIIANFYREFVEGEVLETNAKTAEMTKLTENSFRDANIAFANELSMLCDKWEINVWELIALANRHPRVNILMPSPGVGGHCIAVDPWFIVHASEGKARLIKTSREVNTFKTKWVIEKIKNTALTFEKEHSKKPRVACMGLAFKADIDDLRESPSLSIVKELKSAGLELCIVEPNIKTYAEFELTDYKEALEKSDIMVFLVAHKEFKELKDLNIKLSLDFCGVLDRT